MTYPNLKTEFLGIDLDSPFIIGSGPLTYDSDGMIRAYKAGAGAVVTKTIREDACINPYPHMVRNSQNTLINGEKWADIPGRQWIDVEIPRALEAGVVVIGNVGHSAKQIQQWIKPMEEVGVAAIELVSYEEDNIVAMAELARQLTSIPVIVKLNPNWKNPISIAEQVLDIGVDAISAMDSIGPVLRIDIRTQRPLLGTANGLGWLTGTAIKPIVLRYIAEIASRFDKPIIGIGGIMDESDAMEYLMVGASVVGLCTAPIMKGIEYLSTLNTRMSELVRELGFKDIAEIRGCALKNLTFDDVLEKFDFQYDPEKCTECGMCVKVCPYNARNMDGKAMFLDDELCRYCGLCASSCRPGALRIR